MSITAEDAKVIGKTIQAALDGLVTGSNGKAPAAVPTSGRERVAPPLPAKPDAQVAGRQFYDMNPDATEALYQVFKRRMIDDARVDPVLLHLLTKQPEIVVEVEPQIVTLDGTTLKGRCARLLASGWFTEPRTTSKTRGELARLGADPSGNDNLRKALADFRKMGFLTDEKDGWQIAPGVKVTEKRIEA